MKSKLSSPVDLESISLDDDPNYKRAKDKLAELQVELLHTETRIGELLNEMNSASGDRAESLVELALARIAGREVPPVSRAELWKPLDHLHGERRVGLLPS